MTTSGTTAFNLSLSELTEEAFERCGSEMRSGYDLRTARRSLNLLTLEWANMGINLWTVEQGEIALQPGVSEYDLPNDTIDLIEHVIRTGSGTTQQDINISRISVSTYAMIPNKTAPGRPVQLYINRQSGADYPVTGVNNPSVNVWPVPDSSTAYKLVYWRLRRIQDAGAGGVATPDIPFRFLPALVAGLAFHLSLKIPGASTRSADLKLMYDDAMQKAMDEDRDRAPVRFVPRVML